MFSFFVLDKEGLEEISLIKNGCINQKFFIFVDGLQLQDFLF